MFVREIYPLWLAGAILPVTRQTPHGYKRLQTTAGGPLGRCVNPISLQSLPYNRRYHAIEKAIGSHRYVSTTMATMPSRFNNRPARDIWGIVT